MSHTMKLMREEGNVSEQNFGFMPNMTIAVFASRLLMYKDKSCIMFWELLRLDGTLLGLEFLYFFADDIVIYGNSREEMEENLKRPEYNLKEKNQAEL